MRLHNNILFEQKPVAFSSENPEARGNIAVATLTSGEGFAAEKGQGLAEGVC